MKLFALLLTLSWVSGTHSLPSNDECIGATTIPSIVAVPFIDTVLNVQSATSNPTDPFSRCIFETLPTIWYDWVPTSNAVVDITVVGRDLENDFIIFPRAVSIFKGDACSDNLRMVVCTADDHFIQSFSVTAGQKYFVVLLLNAFISSNASITFEIANVPPPPPNDECVDAIIIPSDVTFPYTAQVVNPRSATENPNDPVSSCSIPLSFPNPASFIRLSSFPTSAPWSFPTSAPFPTPPPIATVFESVWYTWIPSITGLYDFSTQLSILELDFSTNMEIYEGSTCGSVVEIACDTTGSGNIRRVELNSRTNYYIKVFGNFGNELILTVTPTPPPPQNDECINAISVDPLAGEILIGNTEDALLDEFSSKFCGASISAPGIWYKITNVSLTPLPIDVATCSEGTTYDTVISAFSGTCDNLQCVGGNDDACSSTSSKFSFVASPLTTYYILVHGFGTENGEFSLTVDGSLNFFSLIDSKTDELFQAIGNSDVVNYSSLPSSTLNIQASFENAQSARVTFDNPRRSNCERQAPFAIFGDKNGDYFNATIPIGSHTVTATPYTGVDCKGTAGVTLSKTFEVGGCGLLYVLHDFTTNSIEELIRNPTIPICNINLEVVPFCGFEVGYVRFQVRSAVTNTVIISRRENRPPYFMFSNQGEVVNSGSIEPGDYTIEINIDGINHEVVEFSAIDYGRCN